MQNLGQALIEAGVLTPSQLNEAMSVEGASLAATLVEKGFVKETVLVATASHTFAIPKATDADLRPTGEVKELVPAEVVERTLCLPLRKQGNSLVIATADPGDELSITEIGRVSGLSIECRVAGPVAIRNAIQGVYGAKSAGSKALDLSAHTIADLDEMLRHAVQETDKADVTEGEDIRGLEKLAVNKLDPPAVRIVNGLLLKALKMGASDIHIEVLEKEIRVRFRIDGRLIEAMRLPIDLKHILASRLKILSGMDISERRIPQDGGIKLAVGDRSTIDFRASSLPNIYGEKLVLRVLGNTEIRESIDELGFEGQAMEWVREAIANPYGMILVTGPTGSGKTTTLYTILNQLNDDGVNIVTAEDPVEYRLRGITQVNVRPSAGLTFDLAMRAFLRQDPDMILVGEMRDYETAAIAVKAALTGHLVLSTVHTNDASSTIVRLVDMGIEPYLVASAVKLVISQRLLRRICENCKVQADMAELERTDLDQATLASVEAHHRGQGCERCNGTGYRGRVPVHEVLAVKSKDLKRAITEGGTEVQVAQIAKREGMQSLSESAIEKVNLGITTIDEAVSVIAAE